jgi:hypothetical protein
MWNYLFAETDGTGGKGRGGEGERYNAGQDKGVTNSDVLAPNKTIVGFDGVLIIGRVGHG